MSNRYKGGFITATPPTTSSSSQSAPGIWTTTQQMQIVAAGNWPPYLPTDPYYEYVTMLLTGNGTNGAQNNTFLDSSSNAFSITRNGDTTQGSFSPYGSLWGNYFNGSTDYLNGPTNNSAFDFSTGDFTVECWVFATSSSDASIYTNFGPSGAGGLELVTSSGYLFVWNHTAASLSMTSNTLLPLNQWVHVAVTRSGNNFTIWQNGVSVATQTISVTLKTNASSPVCIGGIYSGGGVAIPSWKGYISNLRVTKGGCLYTTTFTPSTTPLTTTVASGTVSWLTCQSNRFADSSANAFAMTVGGSPSVQRFSPFNPTASYDTATIGGSGYFDGTGDYLTVPASSNLTVASGSNTFTLELWIYPTDLGTTEAKYIMGSYPGAGTGHWLLWLSNGVPQLYVFPYFDWLGSIAINKNTWNHIAIVKNLTTYKMFVNGVQSFSENTSGAFGDSNYATYFGTGWSTGRPPMLGNLSDVRFTNTAVYTTTFTPPTAPLTAISGTQLLLNMTNAGIPDSAMMNDGLTVNNAQVSTTQKKFGTASMKFVATSSTVGDFLSFPASPNYDLSGGAFTIEAWIYPTSVTGYQAIVSRTPTIWKLGLFDNLLQWYNGSSTLESSGTISINTWTHVAVTGDGTTVRLFINGTLTASSTGINPQSGLGVLNVGAPANGTYGGRYTDEFYSGYIDDLRITKGYARYTANFTPPTEAFPTF